nr:MAG TPA: hypothetical protein [Bacteriophage sp.]
MRCVIFFLQAAFRKRNDRNEKMENMNDLAVTALQ